MNLVAKEYVACRSDLGGALVLSEFTGAAAELRQAYLVNPHDLEGVKDAIEAALNQSDEEGRRRMRALRRQVLAHDVDRWARSFLDALAESHPRAKIDQRRKPWFSRRIAVILRCSVRGSAGTSEGGRSEASVAGWPLVPASARPSQRRMVMESGEPGACGRTPAGRHLHFNMAGASGATWTITALCDQVNGSRYYKDYDNPDIMARFLCVERRERDAPARPARDQDKLQNFSGRARLSGGLWTFQGRRRPRAWPARAAATGRVRRNLRVRQRDARRHAHHVARRGLRPAAGDEEGTVLAGNSSVPHPARSSVTRCSATTLRCASERSARLDRRDVGDQPLAADQLEVHPQPAAVVERLP